MMDFIEMVLFAIIILMLCYVIFNLGIIYQLNTEIKELDEEIKKLHAIKESDTE